MKIGIIDADLIGQREHNFPNLALMKLSGFYKKQGHKTELIHYSAIDPCSLFIRHFDKVYISKVFTNTTMPKHILDLDCVEYGGTGFYYDKAPGLPYEIEHCFPDYNLYDNWIKEKIRRGKSESFYKYYTDFSIGFTTRGCFRQCEFCVNRNEKKVYVHSPVAEFLDNNRKKICLLDDNVFGCGESWEAIIRELQTTKKPFQFKQGLDIRILSDKKAEALSRSKYDGDYIFAFDNIEDKSKIEDKLKLFKKYMPTIIPKLYLFCAFDRAGKYDINFWEQDTIDLLERVKILKAHKSKSYMMRFKKWQEAPNPFRDFYSCMANYCNVPAVYSKMSINDFIKEPEGRGKGLRAYKNKHPDIADRYFNLKY